MSQNNSDIVVALDIGTTKICAIAGYLNDLDKLEIVGFGEVPSPNTSRGAIRIEKTTNAIREVLNLIEEQIDKKVETVDIGITGLNIQSIEQPGILIRRSNGEIQQADIDSLVSDMKRLTFPPEQKIIHVIPQEFTVDKETGIREPIGMTGIRLETMFHIITGQTSSISKCVEKAGVKVGSINLEPISSAAAILSDEEKEAGVALVDIGGGTTNIVIYHKGIIRHTAVIPLGGNVVTSDIKEGCQIMESAAEKVKLKYGIALSKEAYSNRYIIIPRDGREPKEILEQNLAKIIEARMEEIFDHVYIEIEKSGLLGKLNAGGIVLTGGGALLKHLDSLVEYHTGISTRVATPIRHLAHGYSEKVANPVYSSTIGLLLNSIKRHEYLKSVQVIEEIKPTHEEEEEYEEEEADTGQKFARGLLKRVSDFFSAEPDSKI